MKRKFKFQSYKICLTTTQIDNKISHLPKKKIDIDSIKRYYKEFIKSNK